MKCIIKVMDDYQINMPCAFEAKCGLSASKCRELFLVDRLLMFNMKFFPWPVSPRPFYFLTLCLPGPDQIHS
jgi:hypothetical protein